MTYGVSSSGVSLPPVIEGFRAKRLEYLRGRAGELLVGHESWKEDQFGAESAFGLVYERLSCGHLLNEGRASRKCLKCDLEHNSE